jgi:hypothetical protein
VRSRWTSWFGGADAGAAAPHASKDARRKERERQWAAKRATAAPTPAPAKPPANQPTPLLARASVAPSAVPLPTAVSTAWTPPPELLAARRTMILSLVQRDSKRLLAHTLTVLRHAMPWSRPAANRSLKESLRELQRRTPLLQWHVHNNVLPADVRTLLPPGHEHNPLDSLLRPVESAAMRSGRGLPRSRTPVPPPTHAAADSVARSSLGVRSSVGGAGGKRAPELKDALLEVTPVFFDLVKQAARADPGRAIALYRRVASALVILGWWKAGRAVNAGPERQYPLMNDFLEKIVAIVTECEGILGCDGDEGCVVQAVEAQQEHMRQEVQRAKGRGSEWP